MYIDKQLSPTPQTQSFESSNNNINFQNFCR